MQTEVSIIIPVKRHNKNLAECIDACLKLNYENYEIIVLPDEITPGEFPENNKVKIIVTGNIGPSEKRDLGIKNSNGKVLAFLDDDTYPIPDWLNAAVKNFSDADIAAVGGPAVTPEHDSMMQKASGFVYSSYLASSGYTYRYIPMGKRFVDDYPSCNFIVRREIIEKAGGFASFYWPGEDTIICLKITKELGKKIIYDPEVLVYHHRRNLFLPHLKQISNYGLHRGYFAKRFPSTSLRFSYFVPSVFLVWIVAGILSFIIPVEIRLILILKIIFVVSLIVYIVLLFKEGVNRGLKFFLPVTTGIFLTHITYGMYFLKGLLAKELSR